MDWPGACRGEWKQASVRGYTQIPVSLKFDVKFIVTDDIMVNAILGLDFVQENHCIIDCGRRLITFPSKEFSRDDGRRYNCPRTIGLVIQSATTVPAGSEMEIVVTPLEKINKDAWIVESEVSGRHGVMVAHALVCPNNQSVPIRVLNPREQLVVLKKGEFIARIARTQRECSRRFRELSPEDKETLWNMVSEVGDHTSLIEKEQVFSLLVAYGDDFSFHDSDVSHISATEHRIETGNTSPVRCTPRRIPHAWKEEVRKLLRVMLERGVIQPSDSPWCSPIVLVRKQDGLVRFCVDYRKVNAITRKDAYPLPRIHETLDTLARSRLFTTLDLKSGYWQVEVAEADRQKTALGTSEGLYQFNMMPFGLCNAPATFQRLMNKVLHGLKWYNCLVYIDDIIVVGGNMQEHLHNLGCVLMRLREAGLKLKPSKCRFLQKEAKFLGHVVSEKGISTNPKKTEYGTGWPRIVDGNCSSSLALQIIIDDLLKAVH